MANQGETKPRLLELLEGRDTVQWGEQAELARTVGCSRRFVGYVMRELGIQILPPEATRCFGVRSQDSESPSASAALPGLLYEGTPGNADVQELWQGVHAHPVRP